MAICYCILHVFLLAQIKIQFERSLYIVQESCTLLSVTLVVVGEVREEFTIGVYAVNYYVPLARGKGSE